MQKLSQFWLMLVLVFLRLGHAQSSADIGELFASETTAHGPVLLAGTGMNVASGSQVAAGKAVATLRLARGGEVRLCPNASLAVSVVQNNVPQRDQELMLSMDSGSLEIDYPLNDLADSLITPDFRIMLAGPGVFHFGFAVNNRGDTCIKPLRGNSASLIVTELLGSGVYQVKPDEALTFSAGKLSGRGPLDSDCGCPQPAPVVEAKKEERPLPEPPATPPPDASRPAEIPNTGPPADATATKPEANHMVVEVPMIFRANQPEPAYIVAKIRFSALPNMHLPKEIEKPVVLRPGKGQVSAKNAEKKGFWGGIKGFFAGLFHR